MCALPHSAGSQHAENAFDPCLLSYAPSVLSCQEWARGGRKSRRRHPCKPPDLKKLQAIAMAMLLLRKIYVCTQSKTVTMYEDSL
jgi:hypothetical protein